MRKLPVSEPEPSVASASVAAMETSGAAMDLIFIVADLWALSSAYAESACRSRTTVSLLAASPSGCAVSERGWMATVTESSPAGMVTL
jgi:hypothetical protein